ncbi:hypothetical protein A3K93_09100 [Acinetobacter sp. NCu2D-2]|uniref:hypothetical protein n=1 Tax=Acinetobacter sp. NCu2D-2 TaxID=1608473 RepID=UPI0007CDFE5E|nr:hypothetical protein [Acinetobacter sp. NCu2D-2]ANF83152.1 hypothetical protein A3K93_09100 [Acinetobacter sp. NCu2D-2]
MSQFAEKLACIDKNKFIKNTVILLTLSLTSAWIYANTQKPKWYRYYDSKGVANISTNVTPNHIRYGYEALDQNMQVIQRARPYNVEADIKQAPQRAIQQQCKAEDAKLKRAYTNSHIATQKKKEALTQLKKQIAFQQEQLKQLQTDRITFVRQEREIARKGKNIPEHLKLTLDTNQKNIINQKENIQSLQSRYRNMEAEYDRIISRLKALE